MIRPFSCSLVAVAALVFSSLSLAGCATVLDGPTENVRIDIAGAGRAVCDVTQPGRRYRVDAPGSFHVMKSGDPLKFHCRAPGNREKVIVLEPQLAESSAYNVTNLGIGEAWDAMSGAAHEYPKRILVDFSGEQPKSYPLPDYQTVLERNPELTGMEQFNPGLPALQSDQGQGVPSLKLRDDTDPGSSEIMMPVAPSSSSSASSSPSSSTPATPAAQPTVLGGSGASMSSSASVKSVTPGERPASHGSAPLRIFNDKIGTVGDSGAPSSAGH